LCIALLAGGADKRILAPSRLFAARVVRAREEVIFSHLLFIRTTWCKSRVEYLNEMTTFVGLALSFHLHLREGLKY